MEIKTLNKAKISCAGGLPCTACNSWGQHLGLLACKNGCSSEFSHLVMMGICLTSFFCYVNKPWPCWMLWKSSPLPSPGRALGGALDHGDPRWPQCEESGWKLRPLLHICCFCYLDGSDSPGHGGPVCFSPCSSLALVSYRNAQKPQSSLW